MERIKLLKCIKENQLIKYDFSVSEGLKQFFSNKEFIIRYPEKIEDVPEGIAVIPFVCNVIPIIWITDSELIVDELDEHFYNCLDNVKNGYIAMFPETSFKGKLNVKQIIKNDRPSAKTNCAMFYSGGVDSLDTLYRHLDEKPTLVSIWGSDIAYDNEHGWELVHSAIKEAGDHFQLDEIVIRSTFRMFDSERQLAKVYAKQLKDDWWHGVKHGIGLLGHVAPYAYLHRVQTVYIASSFCKDDGPVRCASDPTIDNFVRFADCQVIHDGYENSRQQKMHNIVNYSESHNDFIPLHVCWVTQTGTNCCHCEKCFRTIAGIIAEGGNPQKYGFDNFEQYQNDMIPQIRKSDPLRIYQFWPPIQNAVKANKKAIRHNPYWKYIKWIEKADFSNPVGLQEPLLVRLEKAKTIRGKLSEFKFYQSLHEWKVKHK